MDIGVVLTVLWPYLAVLYVLDCFLVVRGGHILLSGTPGTGFRARGPGLRLTGLLPWQWSVLSFRDLPLFSKEGLYARVAPFPEDHRPPCPGDYELLPSDGKLQIQQNGRRIIADGRVAINAPTGVAAGFLTGKIREVMSSPGPEGAQALKTFLESAFEPGLIEKAVDEIKGQTAHLVCASSLFFFLVFLLLPVSLMARLPLSWLWIELALISLTYLLVILLWWRAHKALLPGYVGDRLEEIAVFVFFPVSAMHAFGKLTRRLLAPFDSSALSAVLGPEEAEGTLKRAYIRAHTAADNAGDGDLKRLWTLRMDLLKSVAVELDVDPDGLAHSSTHPDLEEGTVCPLCSAAYREGIRECSDCGVPLGTDGLSVGETAGAPSGRQKNHADEVLA